MESTDVAERKWACVAVSNLIQNDPSTRRLLQGKNVVGALITRLTDSEEEVIVEAVGALRYNFLGFFLRLFFLQNGILTEIYALMVVMTFAQRCITKTSWSPSKHLSQKLFHFTSFKSITNCLFVFLVRYHQPFPNTSQNPKNQRKAFKR